MSECIFIYSLKRIVLLKFINSLRLVRLFIDVIVDTPPHDTMRTPKKAEAPTNYRRHGAFDNF